MKNLFSGKTGIITAGILIGIIAPLLQFWGNPPNMGVCVACFERDIAGALGLHRAGIVQYLRPEIFGILLGAVIAAFSFKEFRPTAGSSTLIRFFLGFFAMIGALVFLGCPWRVMLRIGGGDFNGLVGLAGLVAGIFIGVQFLNKGFNLGKALPSERKLPGWLMPGLAVLLLVIGFLKVSFAENGPLFFSTEGPGSKHAPFLISLGAGLLIGIIAQRSRFCTVGAFRDIFITRDLHLFWGVFGLIATVIVMNLILGQFHAGFTLTTTDAVTGAIVSKPQPIAHTMHFWNFTGMVLSGLAFTLAGGCPGRQLIMTGQGDNDAAVFVIGMVAGGAFAHNFSMASSAAGIGAFGAAGTMIGIVFCLTVGFFMLQKRSA